MQLDRADEIRPVDCTGRTVSLPKLELTAGRWNPSPETRLHRTERISPTESARHTLVSLIHRSFGPSSHIALAAGDTPVTQLCGQTEQSARHFSTCPPPPIPEPVGVWRCRSRRHTRRGTTHRMNISPWTL